MKRRGGKWKSTRKNIVLGGPGPVILPPQYQRAFTFYEIFSPAKDEEPYNMEIPWTDMNDYIIEYGLTGTPMFEIMIHRKILLFTKLHHGPPIIRKIDDDTFMYFTNDILPIVQFDHKFYDLDSVRCTTMHFHNWIDSEHCMLDDEEKTLMKLRYC